MNQNQNQKINIGGNDFSLVSKAQVGNKNFLFVSAVILLALIVASRTIPHAGNFTPTIALMLLCGSVFNRKRGLSFATVLIAAFITDLILGTYPGFWINYLAFAGVAGIGMLVSRKNLPSVLTGGFIATAIFYLISNFGVWVFADAYSPALYTSDASGLISCYVAGLPFLYRTMGATLVFAPLIYWAWNSLEVRLHSMVLSARQSD